MDSKESPFLSNVRMVLICCNIALGTFQFGFSVTAFNPIQRVISKIENWGSEAALKIALGTVFLPIGGLVGNIYSNALFNKFGRKKIIYISDSLTCIGAMLSVIFNFECLCISRFIYGLAINLDMALVPVFFREFIPRSFLGRFGSLTNASIMFGSIITFTFAFGLPKVNDIPNVSEFQMNFWRIMIGFPFVIALTRSLIVRFLFNFETPLRAIYESNNSELEKYLKILIKPHFHENFKIQFENDSLQKTKISYRELFQEFVFPRTKVIFLISVLRQLSGSNIINFYSTAIIVSSGLAGGSSIEYVSYGFNIAFASIQLIISVYGGKLFDTYGRKPIFVAGSLICSVAHICISIFSFVNIKQAVPFFILLYGFGFGFVGPVTLMYNAEISNASGQSFSQIINWILSIVLSFIFPILSPYIGIEGFFLIFGISCFIGSIYALLNLHETKGKSRKEIELLFLTKELRMKYEIPESKDLANTEP